MPHIEPIAYISTDFGTKFGVPRQSGLIENLESAIVFEKPYRDIQAVRGLEGFSHLWLIWGFSEIKESHWRPTVRPPRLGGNTRMGVFSTRSPYRPNHLGLSAVRLEKISFEENGPVLHLRGADLMNGTPIYDIKPYLPYTDAYPDATGGFAGEKPQANLQIEETPALQNFPAAKRAALLAVLQNDPRPPYQKDTQRVYGMVFAGYEIKFSVEGQLLQVLEVHPC